MLLNISSRYLGGLFWSRQLRGLPSSDGFFYKIILICIYWLKRSLSISFVKHGSMHDRLYQAQNKFNRNNDYLKKYVLLFDDNQHVNLELWCWGEFVVECWSPIVICTPAYHSLCIVHAQWSPATFLGKGLIPLVHLYYNRPYVLNGIDIWTLYWPQKVIDFRAGSKFLAFPCCMKCCPILHKGNSICQFIVVYVWLNMRPADFISIFMCR